MRKRIVSGLLAAVLGVSLLTGCGGYKPELPTESVEADIFVAPVENLPEDFIKGMDISSVIAEEESGVVYRNENGEEEDLFKILADSGVNYIRVRVWNDPYDEEGNGYGGGNCDVDKAVTIGKRASEYGMKLLVDFHYSDFWADPNKQYCPKAWKGTSASEKAELLYDFTTESLTKIIKGGADVGMVQIGNEINPGMSSVYSESEIMELLKSGSKAVREVASKNKADIKIAVHYTEIDNFDDTVNRAQKLEDYSVDYDVFGVSYYPFWHGTMDNMTAVLSEIKEKFGKDTCVLETSYPYTGEDGDASGNSVSEEDCLEEYPVSVQGQATAVRDVIAHASDAGSLGVFYWEGAWIPVGSQYESNSKIWEQYGSGWASSFAGSYDPKDAGQYYGGSSWDNQAFFDFEGQKLASLDVFKYVNYGAACEPKVLAYREIKIESAINEPLSMPETVDAIYNDPSLTDGVAVTWDADQLEAVDPSKAGEYTVDGTTADGTTVTASVRITNINYIQNPSFEDADISMWTVDYPNGNECTDIQTKAGDCITGENSFHFYSESEQEFSVEQTLSGLGAGSYTADANIQGGDVGADAVVMLYVVVGDKRYESEPVTLDGWVNWKKTVISDIPVAEGDEVHVGMYVKCAAKGWGTIDDFEFYCQQ